MMFFLLFCDFLLLRDYTVLATAFWHWLGTSSRQHSILQPQLLISTGGGIHRTCIANHHYQPEIPQRRNFHSALMVICYQVECATILMRREMLWRYRQYPEMHFWYFEGSLEWQATIPQKRRGVRLDHLSSNTPQTCSVCKFTLQ